MTVRQFVVSLWLLIALTACGQFDPNDSVDEGVIKENTYISREIGWTINIPDGWAVVPKDKRVDTDKQGLEFIKNATDVNLQITELKHLISFKKNRFNVFLSTIEPFGSNDIVEWQENNKALRELILATYNKQGLKASATDISTETIDGLEFQRYEITIHGPDDNILLSQLSYSRLIKGLDFGISISFNNPTDKKTMLNSWLNSQFDDISAISAKAQNTGALKTRP
jgi:hypothetical protein